MAHLDRQTVQLTGADITARARRQAHAKLVALLDRNRGGQLHYMTELFIGETDHWRSIVEDRGRELVSCDDVQ